MTDSVFHGVDTYIGELFAPEDKVLSDTLQSIETNGMPQHSVSASQGRFLQVMMKLCNAKRVLELGTLGGYSTIWLARALPEGGKIVTIETNASYAQVAKQNFERAGLKDKIEQVTGSGLEVLPKLIAQKSGPFDLVFIDADKSPYTEYFEYAIQLSRPGTLIICDNVIRAGEVLNRESDDKKVKGVQRFNEALGKNPFVTAVILPTIGVKGYDGMAVAVVNG